MIEEDLRKRYEEGIAERAKVVADHAKLLEELDALLGGKASESLLFRLLNIPPFEELLGKYGKRKPSGS